MGDEMTTDEEARAAAYWALLEPVRIASEEERAAELALEEARLKIEDAARRAMREGAGWADLATARNWGRISAGEEDE